MKQTEEIPSNIRLIRSFKLEAGKDLRQQNIFDFISLIATAQVNNDARACLQMSCERR